MNTKEHQSEPAPELTHVATGHFGIPEVNPGDQSKNGSWSHYVVEVPDHVIGVVKENITVVEAQWQARQTTDPEHGQECQGKEHWRVETNSPPQSEINRQDK